MTDNTEEVVRCDHDWEWVDDSFDHEYGTEQCGHYECVVCGESDSERQYEPEYFGDEAI